MGRILPLIVCLALAVTAQLVIISTLADDTPEAAVHTDIGARFQEGSFVRVGIDIIETDEHSYPDTTMRLNPHPRTVHLNSTTDTVIWTNLTDETIHISLPNSADFRVPFPHIYYGFIPPHEQLVLTFDSKTNHRVHMHVDGKPEIHPVWIFTINHQIIRE